MHCRLVAAKKHANGVPDVHFPALFEIRQHASTKWKQGEMSPPRHPCRHEAHFGRGCAGVLVCATWNRHALLMRSIVVFLHTHTLSLSHILTHPSFAMNRPPPIGRHRRHANNQGRRSKPHITTCMCRWASRWRISPLRLGTPSSFCTTATSIGCKCTITTFG